MAATTPATTQISESHNNNNEVRKEDIQTAISEAVELRALHAALVHGNSPVNTRFPSASPVSHHASQFSAQDYPVFTPSYEDEPLPGYQQIQLEKPNFPESWDGYSLGGNGDEGTILSNYKKAIAPSRKGFSSEFLNSQPHLYPFRDKKSIASSRANHITLLKKSPRTELFKPRRNSVGDFRSVSSCNTWQPAITTTEAHGTTKNVKYSNTVQTQPKNWGFNFSWLFPRLKKKYKNENSPNRTESEDVFSQISKDLGIMSIETLKKEVMEANERRDVALMEVAEMKSSLGELRQKLEYLETYCEELKKALTHVPENLPKRGKLKSIDLNGENSIPFSEEVMVEGFLQMVTEARLSVKQFCKTLVGQIEETDETLVENLNSILQPHKLSLHSKYSKTVSYHLEAIVNQSLYQDFENCVFQKNGTRKLLDPRQDRRAQFSSYVALRNLSWNEVLRKGTKYYSEEFSKYCDQKMSCIITSLNWTRPWPEQLLQAFFVAAKCVWLVHLLAFSFNPVVGILRVEENRSFDPHYMEDIFMDRRRSQGPSRVKIMVMPGFYVEDRVLRCKVLCRYKSVA